MIVKIINSHGQEVRIPQNPSYWKSLKKRKIQFVEDEIKEVLDRLSDKRMRKTVTPFEVGVELGIRIGAVRTVFSQMEKAGLLKRTERTIYNINIPKKERGRDGL